VEYSHDLAAAVAEAVITIKIYHLVGRRPTGLILVELSVELEMAARSDCFTDSN